MDAGRMNKVTRLAFGGPSQFYSTTSQVCVRRFETFRGLDTSSIREDDRHPKGRSRSGAVLLNSVKTLPTKLTFCLSKGLYTHDASPRHRSLSRNATAPLSASSCRGTIV